MSDLADEPHTTSSKVSPITRKLLNLPGQSLDIRLQDFAADHFLLPMMVVAMLLIMCITEWTGYLSHSERNPWGLSAMFIVTAVAFGMRWRRDWAELKALKLGRDGERAMAEYMDQRLDPSARVFQDIPTAHGNVDHLIICSRGIYAVETKTRSKPPRRGAVVTVTSECLQVDGIAPDRDPISQARTGAMDLHQVLKTFTKKPVWVTPVVVFPGWSVLDRREFPAPVWVLGGSELAERIAQRSESLSALDVARLSRHLTRHIRAAK